MNRHSYLTGLAVIALVYFSGTRDYLGLGTLPATPGGLALDTFFSGVSEVPQGAWAWKLAFTHPTDGRRLAFESPLPADLQSVLDAVREKQDESNGEGNSQ